MTTIASAEIAQSLEEYLNAHVSVVTAVNAVIRTSVKTAHVLMVAVVREVQRNLFASVLKAIRESDANKTCAAVEMVADVCQLSQNMGTTPAYVGPTLWALSVRYLSQNLVMKSFVKTEVSVD